MNKKLLLLWLAIMSMATLPLPVFADQASDHLTALAQCMAQSKKIELLDMVYGYCLVAIPSILGMGAIGALASAAHQAAREMKATGKQVVSMARSVASTGSGAAGVSAAKYSKGVEKTQDSAQKMGRAQFGNMMFKNLETQAHMENAARRTASQEKRTALQDQERQTKEMAGPQARFDNAGKAIFGNSVSEAQKVLNDPDKGVFAKNLDNGKTYDNLGDIRTAQDKGERLGVLYNPKILGKNDAVELMRDSAPNSHVGYKGHDGNVNLMTTKTKSDGKNLGDGTDSHYKPILGKDFLDASYMR